MISFGTMNKRAFSLLELLIVVAIIAVLVGVALPYYQDYIKDTKKVKAKHELDVIKQALIKYDTFEDRTFQTNDLRVLLGRYLQDLPRDPWGRDYKVDYIKGQVSSGGPNNQTTNDDIVVDYKPPLTLQSALWVDSDKNRHISSGDYLKLDFSRYLKSGEALTYSNASPTTTGVDLQFSPDVVVGDLIATTTPLASSTELLIELDTTATDNTFFPGSSTVRVALTNDGLMDNSNVKANGTASGSPSLEVIIKAD